MRGPSVRSALTRARRSANCRSSSGSIGAPGGGPGETLAARLSRLSHVAATNPDAWFPRAWTAEQLRSDAGGNRLDATPALRCAALSPSSFAKEMQR